jgi:protein-tyrosine kinase
VSIQRTIERAIATAKERHAAQAGLSPPAGGAPPNLTASNSSPAASAAHTKQRQAASKPTLKSAHFPRVDLDVAICTQNRILVPGGDELLDMRGAAPYRMLRTRILHRVRTSGWTAIGLTSPGPSEGKSLTALNLSLSVAREMNSNVFLIDLDLRNPSMAPYLGVTPPHSIVDFLSGGISAEQVLFSIGVDNLLLAGSTKGTPHSSELIAAGRHMELFAYIAAISPQPLIFVDLPPVLSTDEALVVAPQLDAIFMVIGEGITRRDGLKRAVDLLSEFSLAGVILNKSRGVGQDYYSGVYD